MLAAVRLILIFPILLGSFSLLAQFVDTEILDHTNINYQLGSMTSYDGTLIYSVVNDRAGYVTTDVKYADRGQLPISFLDAPLHFKSRSSWEYDAQGRLRFFVYDFNNLSFDSFSSSVLEIVCDGAGCHERWLDFDNPGSLETVQSVGLDSSGLVYALSNFSVLRVYDEGELLNTIDLGMTIEGKLMIASSGKFYVASEQDRNLFSLESDELVLLKNIAHDIAGVKRVGNSFWIYDGKGNIYIHPDNFSSAGVLLDCPFEVHSLDQFSVLGDQIFAIAATHAGHDLYRYGPDGFEQIESREEDFASSSTLHMLSDSTYLSAGQYQIGVISDQAFMRGYEMSQDYHPERCQVMLDSLSIHYVRDSMVTGAPTALAWYCVDGYLSNLQAMDVEPAHVYTSDLLSKVDFLYRPWSHSVESVPSFGGLAFQDDILLPFDHPKSVTATIPGCAYRFNTSAISIIADLITSTSDINIGEEVKVYPNPFVDHLVVESSSSNPAIVLYDSFGQQIIKGKAEALQGRTLSKLPSGMYLLQVEGLASAVPLLKR